MKSKKRQSEFIGRLCEYIAIIYLSIKFYIVFKHRHKTPFGEIDIIARRKKYLLFIEVKFRKNIDNAKYSVTDYQKQRIIKAANYYCAKNKWSKDFIWQYDIIAISPFKIIHIKNAFNLGDLKTKSFDQF